MCIIKYIIVGGEKMNLIKSDYPVKVRLVNCNLLSVIHAMSDFKDINLKVSNGIWFEKEVVRFGDLVKAEDTENGLEIYGYVYAREQLVRTLVDGVTELVFDGGNV